MKSSFLPQFVQKCLKNLRDTGFEAYPVGGCVRDLCLGRPPGDWDVATSALPEAVRALFPRTAPTGIAHGTVTVLFQSGKIEVTTFRRDGTYLDGRHPDTVTFDAGLFEDLSRRDFTINAMALGPDGAVIDPFGGMEDLKKKLIRCVGDPASRFSEDALRMLRAVRFSAQLGFSIEPETAAAIRLLAPLAAKVSAERVRVEVEKTLCSPHPSQGERFFSFGLFPGVKPPDLKGLELVRNIPRYRWAALCRALGSADLLQALKPDKRTLGACRGALAILAEAPVKNWIKMLSRYGPEACETAAAVLGDGSLSALLAGNPCYRTDQLALTGRDLVDLGLHDEQIGQAQHALLAYVLEHPRDNRKEILLGLLREGGEKSF
ncbi:CCA-adding enzyme [bioreactor metagenome]|uniref:CCA-adding enzyme n=1 Tax=bioreactor metagenome TaxID=1076179 RepID=A0A644ZNT9_9ZZZZ